MITPLIILTLLFAPLFLAKMVGGPDHMRLGGTFGLALAFAFFGTGHYVQTGAMMTMLPEFVPQRREIVLASGLLEFGIAAALLAPNSRRFAGFAAIAVFVGFFPVNIYAALNHTGMGGHVWGPEYLLIRAPLQALLIGWAWYFVVRKAEPLLAPGPALRGQRHA